MPEIYQKALSTNVSSDIQSLYARYSAMLLGYIIEVVKDHKLAEDYLIKVFCELSKTKAFTADAAESLSWNQLRVFATGILPASDNHSSDFTASHAVAHQTDKLFHLNADQQFVFNSVYYHGKSITAIAVKLNKTEDTVKKILKSAFAAMKGNREN